MTTFIALRVSDLLGLSFWIWMLMAGSICLPAYGQEGLRYDGFEEYVPGDTQISYWIEQTCATDPCAGCGVVPLIVSDEQARSGKHSIRLMKIGDDAALTGGDYCGYRTQFSNYTDARFDYGEHAWIGFSVFIADHHLTDQWSQNNVWIFQFKNIDAGGGGNQYGSIKSYDRDRNGQFIYHVEGLGDIGAVVLNTWTDFVIHINYRTDSLGLVEVWKNGEHFAKSGSLPAKQNCYLAFDIYGDKMAAGAPANKVYFDEIRFLADVTGEDQFSEVSPSLNNVPVFVEELEKGLFDEITITQVMDEITIELDRNYSEAVDLFLFNTTGQLMMSKSLRMTYNQLSTEHLLPGIYVLHLIDNKGRHFSKKLLLGF